MMYTLVSWGSTSSNIHLTLTDMAQYLYSVICYPCHLLIKSDSSASWFGTKVTVTQMTVQSYQIPNQQQWYLLIKNEIPITSKITIKIKVSTQVIIIIRYYRLLLQLYFVLILFIFLFSKVTQSRAGCREREHGVCMSKDWWQHHPSLSRNAVTSTFTNSIQSQQQRIFTSIDDPTCCTHILTKHSHV